MRLGDNQKLVVTLSGGLDSVTLLYFVRDKGYIPLALSVDYGQRHRKEIESAYAICVDQGIEFFRADLSNLSPLMTGSSQTDGRVVVPEGHYAEETMKLTVVPNRNMILLAVAGAWAVSQKAFGVAYAAHAGDHAIYPDCRPEFMRAMDTALALADWHSLHLYAPFRDKFKADIVREGHRLDVPFAQTWSCYKGEDIHCGQCGTCYERQVAFHVAEVADPTQYAVPLSAEQFARG
jgi:7-cyano-7-deazaguanine synthase